MKKYDAFVSHSSLDKDFARKLSVALSAKGANIWFDEWVMKPGDRLRDKINEGVRLSNYFIVVLSRNSIRSQWVRIELDSAMIREIEKKKVHVIPILLDKEAAKDIPPDLKGKLYIDFSNHRDFVTNTKKLLDTLNTERRLRHEFLQNLKHGLHEDIEIVSITMLEQVLRNSRDDQTIQNAAITGLTRYKSVNAYELIFQRMISTWGLSTIKHCIKVCSKIEASYALLMLAGSLWLDSRVFLEKLEIMHSILSQKGLKKEANLLRSVMTKYLPKAQTLGFPNKEVFKLIYQKVFEKFALSNLDYIKSGIIVSASTNSKELSHGVKLESFVSKEEIKWAWNFFRQAFPDTHKIVRVYNQLPFTTDLLNWITVTKEGIVFKGYKVFDQGKKEPKLVDDIFFKV
jgi:hypothetical protein